MLTRAPLPTWANCYRAMVRRPPSDADLAALWHREGEAAGWLSRSAWSLALIVLWRMRLTGKQEITVWIPDFFCNGPLFYLRFSGVRLVFYPVTESMSPNMEQCRSIGKDTPPDIFLFVHYFGRPANHSAARDFCKLHAAWLIEDAAHSLLPNGSIGSGGDFVIYSPHKHLPIPDGALLIVRPTGPARFESAHFLLFGDSDSWPSQLADLDRKLRVCCGGYLRFHALIWCFKRTLQKFGVGSRRQFNELFAEQMDPNRQRFGKMISPRQSMLSKRLLGVLKHEIADVLRKRQRMQLLLDQALINDSKALGVSPAERPIMREWVPYMASYKGNSTKVEAVYRSWQHKLLPVTTWPDLPPEVALDPRRHAAAWVLRHGRVYLPVHQSISHGVLLRRCTPHQVSPVEETRLRLVWDEATQDQWHSWMCQAGRSNLLQSWSYGEAKCSQAGWIAKRGVFYREGAPVAFVQVLQKRVFGIFLVSRINRGPLLLMPLNEQEQRSMWGELAKLGRLASGHLLSVAPESFLNGQSLAMMASMKFRQFSPRAWESVWIDLGKDIGALRQGLEGKWRNMLKSSEKSGLQLEVDRDLQRFDWMLNKYSGLMQVKHFSGVPIDLLRALRSQSDSENKFELFCAMSDGDPIAAVCVARHGKAATYLLGWNGEKGRSLKANQFLLWNAIVHLKQEGVEWLDLGGISDDQTPGITAFKLGLNGARYELVGEYWKWQLHVSDSDT